MGLRVENIHYTLLGIKHPCPSHECCCADKVGYKLKRIDMEVLNREEMRNVFAGGGSCTVTVTCPNGFWMSCTNSDGQCYKEGDGTITGYINCGVGQIQNACWKHVQPE